MIAFGPEVWDRMVDAVEAVRNRLRRVTAALEQARIPYAVIGGNAVAAWVARIDPAAVRNTQDVDILIRRTDFDALNTALTAAGFEYHQVAGVDMFFDPPSLKVRDAVHILYANELIRPDYYEPTADVDEVETDPLGNYRHLDLEALVRMKLTSYRRKDQVHLLDLIEVGLIDEAWPAKYRPELAERLLTLLDDPNG